MFVVLRLFEWPEKQEFADKFEAFLMVNLADKFNESKKQVVEQRIVVQ